MKLFRLLSLLSLLTAAAFAQDSAGTGTGARDGWGFAAGLSSGTGIAYRKHFESPWGFQVAGIAFGDKSSLKANLGATVMHELQRGETSSFYLLGGFGWYHSAASDGGGGPWTHDSDYGLGAGIGIEFLFMERKLGLGLELPLTVILDDDFAFTSVYPIPSASLVYYF